MTPTRTMTLVAIATVALALPIQALDLNFGIFKRRNANKAKEDAANKTKQLLTTVTSDLDVERRKSAVDALRSIDPKTNADVIGTLSTALAKDPSVEVRMLAADALGSYKTIYESAAKALETAEASDPDASVRKTAKAGLVSYTKLGYQGAGLQADARPSGEPPLAKSPSKSASTTSTSQKTPLNQEFRPIGQGSITAKPMVQTDEPPLAKTGKPLPTIAQPTTVPTVVVPMMMPTVPDMPKLPESKPSSLAPGELPLPVIPSTPTVIPPAKK